MGNTSAQKLKDLYKANKLTYVETRNTKSVGSFNVFQDPARLDGFLMQVYFNPVKYDQTFDVSSFLRAMNDCPQSICKFLFSDESINNPGCFDIVFEFGYSIEKFKMEPAELTRFLWQLFDSLSALESQGFHYPEVSKTSFIISSDKIKLINPFCYPNFLKDVLGVYMNPLKGMSARVNFKQERIKASTREFAIAILSLLMNCKEEEAAGAFKTNRAQLIPKYGQMLVDGLDKLAKKEIELGSYNSFCKVLGINPPPGNSQNNQNKTGAPGQAPNQSIPLHVSLGPAQPTPEPKTQQKLVTSLIFDEKDAKKKTPNVPTEAKHFTATKTGAAPPQTTPSQSLTDSQINQSESLNNSLLGKFMGGIKNISQEIGNKLKPSNWGNKKPIEDFEPLTHIDPNDADDISNSNLVRNANFVAKGKRDSINLNEIFQLQNEVVIKPEVEEVVIVSAEVVAPQGFAKGQNPEDMFKKQPQQGGPGTKPGVSPSGGQDNRGITSSLPPKPQGLLTPQQPGQQAPLVNRPNQAQTLTQQNFQKPATNTPAQQIQNRPAAQSQPQAPAKQISQSLPPASQPQKTLVKSMVGFFSNEQVYKRFLEFSDGSREIQPMTEQEINEHRRQFDPQALASRPVTHQPNASTSNSSLTASQLPSQTISQSQNFSFPTQSFTVGQSQMNAFFYFLLVGPNSTPPVIIFKKRTEQPNSRFQDLQKVVNFDTPNHISAYHLVDDSYMLADPPGAPKKDAEKQSYGVSLNKAGTITIRTNLSNQNKIISKK